MWWPLFSLFGVIDHALYDSDEIALLDSRVGSWITHPPSSILPSCLSVSGTSNIHPHSIYEQSWPQNFFSTFKHEHSISRSLSSPPVNSHSDGWGNLASQHVLISCIFPIPIMIHVIVWLFLVLLRIALPSPRAGHWVLVVDSLDIVLSLVQCSIYEMFRFNCLVGLRTRIFKLHASRFLFCVGHAYNVDSDYLFIHWLSIS
jgi:hypothetical protein